MADHKKPKPYTQEAIYDEKISPLMAKIIEICKEHEIPMMATFQYEWHEERGAGYCTTTLPYEKKASPNFMEALMFLREALVPPQPYVLAETIVTDPNTGKKTITITRVS